MAINNNFYAVMNELFNRASNGTILNVVDYDSFIDSGKVLADMEMEHLQNTFVKALMNKVQKTIYMSRSYRGSFTDMYKGSLDYGVLEMIMGDFYDMNASTFDGETLSEGETYTDQFKVFNLPKASARYYTNSDSWSFDITIRDESDLRGAFASPSAMDSFIRKIFLDVTNSNEFHKELNRLALVAKIIKEVTSDTAEVADENVITKHYNLLAIYNNEMGTELTTANCLLNNDFVSWSVGVIADVSDAITKPLKDVNLLGEITTFSPKDEQSLKVNAIYNKAIRRSLIDAFNPEYGMLTMDYEIVPYWQNKDDRLRVTTNESGDTTYSPSVVAVLMDKRSCGEMVQVEKVGTTRNNKRLYTNYHYNWNYLYFHNPNANVVCFTIG